MDVPEFRKKYFHCITDKNGKVLTCEFMITKEEKAQDQERFTGYYAQMKDVWRKGIGTSEFIDDDLTLDQYISVMTAQKKFGVRYWENRKRHDKQRRDRELELIRREQQ